MKHRIRYFKVGDRLVDRNGREGIVVEHGRLIDPLMPERTFIGAIMRDVETRELYTLNWSVFMEKVE